MPLTQLSLLASEQIHCTLATVRSAVLVSFWIAIHNKPFASQFDINLAFYSDLLLPSFRTTVSLSTISISHPKFTLPTDNVTGRCFAVMLALTWMLCMIGTMAAGFFTLYYGLRLGNATQEKWLFSFSISLLQDIFISQPFKASNLLKHLSTLKIILIAAAFVYKDNNLLPLPKFIVMEILGNYFCIS